MEVRLTKLGWLWWGRHLRLSIVVIWSAAFSLTESAMSQSSRVENIMLKNLEAYFIVSHINYKVLNILEMKIGKIKSSRSPVAS